MDERTYINNLINQYKLAEGIDNLNFKDFQMGNDFYDWLLNQKMIGENYYYYLSETNNEFKNFPEVIVEVGKGKEDTVVYDTDINILTPYVKGLEDRHRGIFLPGRLDVKAGIPYIHSLVDDKTEINFSNFGIKRFMTQNPLLFSDIYGWDDLHNRGEFDITVGVYGNIYDKDMNRKLKMLKEFKEMLNDGYDMNFTYDIDRYYAYITSKRLCYTKKKVKTR